MFALVSAKTGNGVEQAMIDLTKQMNLDFIRDDLEEQKLDPKNLKKNTLYRPTCC